MTGVDIIATILRAHEALTEIVPAENIRAGRLPEGFPLPALLLRTVSSMQTLPLKAGPTIRFADRVSATVRAASYRDQVRVMRLLVKIRIDLQPSFIIDEDRIATRVSVLPAGRGPDLSGPGNSFEQAADWRVGFETTA